MNVDALALDAEPVGYHRLHPDRGIEFQCNRFLQCIGPSALPEIQEAARSIHSYPNWVREFLGLAERARRDRRILAAAFYDRAASFFMAPTDPGRRPAITRFQEQLRELYQLRPVAVRYEDATLPAYDLAPTGAARGTIVVFGGFDEYVEENLPLLQLATRAGYRVIAFDGPGQGAALDDYGLPMTEAWERPVSAVLDHFELDDVTLIGISLGGCLAIRAAAFEARVRRVVTLDVFDDFLECLGRQIGPGATPALRLLLALRARSAVNAAARVAAARKPIAAWGLTQGRYVTGTPDAYGFLQAARRFCTRTVSHRVTADALLLAGANDHYVPVHQLHRQAAALTQARSVTTRLFTAAEHADNHCQIGNMGAALHQILTWLSGLTPAANTSVRFRGFTDV
jgi:pimeloyl-ACP methyl ester carboxylesterase